MLRFLTAGESHGPGLTVIVEGLPPGIPVLPEELSREQARRRWCYGRGGRAAIEQDEVRVTGGVYEGATTGAPVSVWLPNRDYANWAGQSRPVWVPRPGHADLAGAIKYGFTDLRPVVERASARETAARAAAGYLSKQLLRAATPGFALLSWVTSIGAVQAALPPAGERGYLPETALRLAAAAEESPVRCPDPEAASAMVHAIDEARAAGDTLGGTFEVAAIGVPEGLGSYTHWDRRLDTAIAAAVMSINGVKGVEIGSGFAAATRGGRQVHDVIAVAHAAEDGAGGGRRLTKGSAHTHRLSNHAGGIEGGVSNGEMIFVRAAHKPLPMLGVPLPSVDMRTGEAAAAHRERSDVCAAGSAAVVAESMVAIALANAWLERYGHDSVEGAVRR